MSIQLTTPGATGKLRRTSNTTLNYNAAYTVLFSLYVATAGNNSFWWGIGGSSGSGSASQLGSKHDMFMTSASGFWKLNITAAAGGDVISGTKPTSGNWYNVSIRRASATSITLRINGVDRTSSSTDVSAREAVVSELFFRDDNNVSNGGAGDRIQNYKCFDLALTTSEIDVEHTISGNSGLVGTGGAPYSYSTMADETTQANNLVQVGSLTNWIAGAGLGVGVNNPANNAGGPSLARIERGHTLGRGLARGLI